MQGKGLALPPNLNWLHLDWTWLSSGTVSKLKELQFVKSVFQVFMNVDILSLLVVSQMRLEHEQI